MRFHYITLSEYRATRKLHIAALRDLYATWDNERFLTLTLRRAALRKRLAETRSLVA
jgi:hypothetical protein